MTDRPHCRGPKADGTRCGTSLGLSPDGLCLAHDPERQDRARAVRAAGGRAKGESVRAAKEERAKARALNIPAGLPKAPKTLEDAVRWSSWTMHAIATGEIDARAGHEVGYLVARFTEALNKRDLLAEIAKLRADLAEARGQKRGESGPRIA